MSDFEKLKRLTGAATPGPWEVDDPWIVYAQVDGVIIYLAATDKLDTRTDQSYRNAEYIAAANPAAIGRLITEYEAERETADHWRELAEQRQKRIYELAAEANRLRDEVEALRKTDAGLREMLLRQNKTHCRLADEIKQLKKAARNG